MAYKIMIMGASYGSLLASKVLFGGHSVHLICLPAEADLINSEGFRVRMPIRGRKDPIEINSRKLPGKVSAGGTAGVNPGDYDLVGLAMQEPQYRSPGVRELAGCGGEVQGALHVDHEHAAAALCEAHRRPQLRSAEARLYRSHRVGQLRSRDAHAVQPRSAGDPPAGGEGERAAGHAADQLQGGAPQGREIDTPSCASSRRTSKRCASTRGDGKIELPVKLRVYDSIFVPLAKWAMLLAGNYRCVTKDGMRTAQEAVHSDIETSRSVYNFVNDLCVKLGANPADLVPFEKYAAAAQSLVRPASAARALNNGLPNIERADKLVQLIAKQKGLSHPVIDAGVALVDARLEANRKKAAAA